ncbi:MAG TPA: D-alanyl-D-alanine carboxypeptidase/D-alanyl-D-alanine-endopeptidase [Polyangiaceae bacterium]|nr:D-alanyl-D-alanine carboxypeptidase/D-alanyl-D-alanine-endopeptidase [Polyangiaceae bacterium]
MRKRAHTLSAGLAALVLGSLARAEDTPSPVPSPTTPPTASAPASAIPARAPSPPAPSIAPAPSPAEARLVTAVEELGAWAASVKGRAGADVVEIDTGRVLASLDAHRALNPASNTKVLTAAAVLDRLGPDHRFTTGVYGKVENGAVPVLVLRGDGDPSLETADLVELARALVRQGVRRVDRIQVDQGAFDDQYVPPAFASQPNEWAPFRAPVSAVSLERNAVTLNVTPGRAGAPASVWFEPPGFVDVKGVVETRPSSAADGVRLTLRPDGPRLRAEVAGFVGAGATRVRYSKRVDDPRLFPGYALAALLRELGVDVPGDPSLGGNEVRARLAYVESAPVSVLVRELGKNSDNFFAETLLKALGGVVRGAPARTENGASVVLEYLASLQAIDPDTKIVNGSGLFDANRVSPSTLVAVLRHGFQSSRIAPDFVAELAVGGVDGTLRNRFKTHADDRAIRAKTGTLDRVVALSGYVLAPPGRSAIAFSFIVDGAPGKHAEARQRIDRAVEAIFAVLNDGR